MNFSEDILSKLESPEYLSFRKLEGFFAKHAEGVRSVGWGVFYVVVICLYFVAINATRKAPSVSTFSGGDESNRFLSSLGFEVVSKADSNRVIA